MSPPRSVLRALNRQVRSTDDWQRRKYRGNLRTGTAAEPCPHLPTAGRVRAAALLALLSEFAERLPALEDDAEVGVPKEHIDQAQIG
jgi:hypothetical protein